MFVQSVTSQCTLYMTAFILHAFTPSGQWRRSLKISCTGVIDLLEFIQIEDERGPGRAGFWVCLKKRFLIT
jgi:hypothetical protein